MKLVIDIDLENCQPEKGDIIAFDGVKWVCLTHDKAFSCENKKIAEYNGKIDALNTRINTLESYIKTLAKAVKENK